MEAAAVLTELQTGLVVQEVLREVRLQQQVVGVRQALLPVAQVEMAQPVIQPSRAQVLVAVGQTSQVLAGLVVLAGLGVAAVAVVAGVRLAGLVVPVVQGVSW